MSPGKVDTRTERSSGNKKAPGRKLSPDDAPAFSSGTGTGGSRARRQEGSRRESHTASTSEYDSESESMNKDDSEAASLLVAQLQDTQSSGRWETHVSGASVKSQHSSDLGADDDAEEVAARRAYYRKNAARARKRYKDNVTNLRKSVESMRDDIENLKKSNKELEQRIEFLVAEKAELEEYGKKMNLTTDPQIPPGKSIVKPASTSAFPVTNSQVLVSHNSSAQNSETAAALRQLLSSNRGGSQDASAAVSTQATVPPANIPQNDSVNMLSQLLSSQQSILPAASPAPPSQVPDLPSVSLPSSSSLPSEDAASLISKLLLSRQGTVASSPPALPPAPPPVPNLSATDTQNLISLLTALQSSFGSDTAAVLQLLLSPAVAGNPTAVVGLLQLLLQAKGSNSEVTGSSESNHQ